MESTITFKSQKGNNFIYDNSMSYLINCHPILNEIIMSDKDKNDMMMHIIACFPGTTKEDFEYYYQKYLFLKDSGLFKEMNLEKRLSGRISSSIVDEQIANVNDVVFQVTNLCNLSCVYCCYGDLYDNSDRDTIHNVMDFTMAKRLIDFLVEKWNSALNLSHNGHIMIGFYGGEPLTNFSIIKQIVEYTKTIRLNNNATFLYNMTTNSMLLDKYMDFLVEHDFSLLLSLDGNEIHNALRIDINGNPSFTRVFKNIKALQQTYPDFFEHKVRFNSVLNKYSNVQEVQQFIQEEFHKETGIETITYSGIKKERLNDFFKIFRNYDENEETNNRTKDAGFFFYYHIGNAFRHHIDLLRQNKIDTPRIPTGTCLPFWKKMFITPGGNIYACERIGFKHVLGKVCENIMIDSQSIADKYNRFYDTVSKQCLHCYHADSCPSCMMQFEQINGNPVCPSVMTKKKYEEYLSEIISYLETHPDTYNKVNKMIFA